uniref:Uncharacterized protein n=1 Tax=Arundo donax TaxID=35708 RepID=A0A0A9D100_ARUDO
MLNRSVGKPWYRYIWFHPSAIILKRCKCLFEKSNHKYLKTICSAIAKLDVKPGDSIPNKLTSPGMPWTSSP